MTNFERIYLMNRQPKIAITNNTNDNVTEYDITNVIQKFKQDYHMQLQYRELDRLAMELEKEIQEVKRLRIEMEKYKTNFNIDIEDKATNKIKEVINDIDKLFT